MNPSGSGMQPHLPQHDGASPRPTLRQQQQQLSRESPLTSQQQQQQQQQAIQTQRVSPLVQQPQHPRVSPNATGQQDYQRQSPGHQHVRQLQAPSRAQIQHNAHHQQELPQQVPPRAHSAAGALAGPGPSGQGRGGHNNALQRDERARREEMVALCRQRPHEQLGNNLFGFQRNQEFTDITITTAKSSTFKCHKAVLAASSGYFRRTLRNIVDLNCDHPVIALTHVCPDAFTVLIEIMYTGRVLCPISLVTRVGEIARLLEIEDIIYENSSHNQPSSLINPQNVAPAIVNSQNVPASAAAAAAGPLANPMWVHLYNQLAQQQQQHSQHQVVSNAKQVQEVDDEEDQPLVVDEPMEEEKPTRKSKMSNLLKAAAMAFSSRQADKAEPAKDSMELETPKTEKKEPDMDNATNTVSRHKSRKGLPKKMLISRSSSDGAVYNSSPSTLAATSSSSSEGSPEALMRASAAEEQQQKAEKPLSPVAEERPAPCQSDEEMAHEESNDIKAQEERVNTFLQSYFEFQSRMKEEQQHHQPTQALSPPSMVLPATCGLQVLASASLAGASGLHSAGSGMNSLVTAAGYSMDNSQGPSQRHRGRARKANARLARNENGQIIFGNNGKPMVECEICNKQLTDPSSLYRHKKTHTGEKKHMCPICEKRFIQRYNMKQHVTTHADQVIDPMVLQTMDDDLREALIKRIQDRTRN